MCVCVGECVHAPMGYCQFYYRLSWAKFYMTNNVTDSVRLDSTRLSPLTGRGELILYQAHLHIKCKYFANKKIKGIVNVCGYLININLAWKPQRFGLFFCVLLPVCAMAFNESRRNIDYDAALKWSLRCITNDYRIIFKLEKLADQSKNKDT